VLCNQVDLLLLRERVTREQDESIWCRGLRLRIAAMTGLSRPASAFDISS
jgi:hypothetical protein